jgi:hypothetical protein
MLKRHKNSHSLSSSLHSTKGVGLVEIRGVKSSARGKKKRKKEKKKEKTLFDRPAQKFRNLTTFTHRSFP